MSEIMVARKGDREMNEQTMHGMYRLRHDIFHDRLKWDVASEDGMERDVFDQGDPVYVLVKNEEKVVEGCWRLLPTTGPYMLSDVFPQLLYDQAVPRHPKVWELSRFAVAKSAHESIHESASFGLNEIPVRMLQRAVQFAKQNGIDSYVTVTTVAVERLMRNLGLIVHRFGPPMRIGKVMTLALWFDIGGNTEAAAFRQLNDVATRKAA